MTILLRAAARPVGLPVRFGAEPSQQPNTETTEHRHASSPRHSRVSADRLERSGSHRSNTSSPTRRASIEDPQEAEEARTDYVAIDMPQALPNASIVPPPRPPINHHLVQALFHQPHPAPYAQRPHQDYEMGDIQAPPGTPEAPPPDYTPPTVAYLMANHPRFYQHMPAQPQATQAGQQTGQPLLSKKGWALLTLFIVMAGGLGATTTGWITTALNNQQSNTPNTPTPTPTSSPTWPNFPPTGFPIPTTTPKTPICQPTKHPSVPGNETGTGMAGNNAGAADSISQGGNNAGNAGNMGGTAGNIGGNAGNSQPVSPGRPGGMDESQNCVDGGLGHGSEDAGGAQQADNGINKPTHNSTSATPDDSKKSTGDSISAPLDDSKADKENDLKKSGKRKPNP